MLDSRAFPKWFTEPSPDKPVTAPILRPPKAVGPVSWQPRGGGGIPVHGRFKPDLSRAVPPKARRQVRGAGAGGHQAGATAEWAAGRHQEGSMP